MWCNTPHWKVIAVICCARRSPKFTLITVFVSIVAWKQARWPPVYYVFNISLSCNINIPSFIGNLWWVLLLGNHLNCSEITVNSTILLHNEGGNFVENMSALMIDWVERTAVRGCEKFFTGTCVLYLFGQGNVLIGKSHISNSISFTAIYCDHHFAMQCKHLGSIFSPFHG